MFRKVLSLAVFVAIIIPTSVLAQVGTLTGVITDQTTGEELAGATVFIVELEMGTATGLNGEYSLPNIPVGDYTANITYVGYEPIRRNITITAGVNEMNFAMRSELLRLEEMIVTGYGVTQKREVTGSIASIPAREIQDVTLQNPESLLQGRAAGVTVTATSGNPGGAFYVNIRGQGSINAATQPLYIIDGVQISFSQLSGQTSTSPMNNLNPSDIESIEVLKDASAAAIYGAQAAAGVVIITTRRGQRGPTQVTARAETGVRTLARNVNYITSDQYLDYLAEGLEYNFPGALPDMDAYRLNRRNSMLDFFGSPDWTAADRNAYSAARAQGLSIAQALDATGVSTQLANTDWQDFIFSDGVTQRYTVSASGGDASTTFFISGGYEDTEGTAFNSDFTRLNLRTNFDHQVSDRVRASVTSNISRQTQFGVCQDGNFINCPPSQAMFESNMSFPFDADGEYNPWTRFGLQNNPAVIRDEVERQVSVTQILANLNLVYEATDWLSFSGLAGVDYRNTNDERYDSAIARPAEGGWLLFWNRNVQNSNLNLVANAAHTFNDVHNFSGLLGTEYRRNYSEFVRADGEGFTAPFFRVLNATGRPTTASGSNTEWRVGSYFANARYNYNERYYLSVIARYDGHSRFGADTRWGFFPSFSGMWRISQEDFFDVDFIDDLRLRAGYGITGNSAIGNFAARGLFGTGGLYQGLGGLRYAQLANANLGWEEAREINIGLDFELFAGRLTGAVDVYRKDNDQLLFARPLPTDSGFSSITENIGKVRNEGIEFELRSVNVSRGGFLWSSRFNIAFIDNEILELPDGVDIDADDVWEALKIGKPIGLLQVPRWAGVNPADGRPMWYDADGNITYFPNQERDAIEYKDGVANVIGGFGNTLTYRGISLDAFFEFSFGQWAFSGTDFYFTRTPDFLMNMHEEVLDRWREPGDMTHYPRAILAGTDYPETANYRVQAGTHAVYNASYIRLKNISLGYSLPSRWLAGTGISNVQIFASGINLLTWTAWPWYDPEVAFNTQDIWRNFTAASYPTERQFNAGIELRF